MMRWARPKPTGSFVESLDEYEFCHCFANLTNPTFPTDQLHSLEKASHNVTINVKEETTKIHSYENTLVLYMENLKKLTQHVEMMELGGLSYTERDLDLIKFQITELEILIEQLKISLAGSSTTIETLYQEIYRISTMVRQLEVYDQNNVLATRREAAALQKQLEDCEKNLTTSNQPSLPPVDYGSCDHGPITNVSKPFLVQQNILGSSYRYGGWGKDSKLGADQSSFWVSPLSTNARTMDYIYLYASYNDLLIFKYNVQKSPSPYGQGGGMIMYNKVLYYNCYDSKKLCKYSINTGVVDQVVLQNAAYNNRFSYAATSWQDIDLAADEDGLWVIYASEEMGGKILISKLDASSMEVKQTWTTSVYKPGVTNAFMACGILYATRIYNTKTEEIFYMYDTNTGREGPLSVHLEKMSGTMHSLSYNPNDRKLYMYNDGFLVTYYLTFRTKKNIYF
ncbi:olfactomedin-4-like [Hyperolius riggenbachi]|uniref:olfactomedin-4-like n=1 Tax=Hyperolius riggenbachi TaxID=752182 RepID=UPI0035A3B8A4